jgi:hypothetical protein
MKALYRVLLALRLKGYVSDKAYKRWRRTRR